MEPEQQTTNQVKAEFITPAPFVHSFSKKEMQEFSLSPMKMLQHAGVYLALVSDITLQSAADELEATLYCCSSILHDV